MNVTDAHYQKAVGEVVNELVGISNLYPGQYELLDALMRDQNIFYTSSTNSGKTLPGVIFPEILKKLNNLGYNFPRHPKVLFLTALNSIKLSLLSNVKSLGILCGSVTCDNVKDIMASEATVFFISPEVIKIPEVTTALLRHRSEFVLKVVDEAHLGKIKSLL